MADDQEKPSLCYKKLIALRHAAAYLQVFVEKLDQRKEDRIMDAKVATTNTLDKEYLKSPLEKFV